MKTEPTSPEDYARSCFAHREHRDGQLHVYERATVDEIAELFVAAKAEAFLAGAVAMREEAAEKIENAGSIESYWPEGREDLIADIRAIDPKNLKGGK